MSWLSDGPKQQGKAEGQGRTCENGEEPFRKRVGRGGCGAPWVKMPMPLAIYPIRHARIAEMRAIEEEDGDQRLGNE